MRHAFFAGLVPATLLLPVASLTLAVTLTSGGGFVVPPLSLTPPRVVSGASAAIRAVPLPAPATLADDEDASAGATALLKGMGFLFLGPKDKQSSVATWALGRLFSLSTRLPAT